MAAIDRSVASLRIIGDDLVPEEVTRLLGGAPTFAHKRGDVVRNHPRAKERVARFGMWLRKASDHSPEDIDGQVEELLSGLTCDLSLWHELTVKFRADIFCGLFMRHLNEGFTLKPKTLSLLGSRGVEIGFDIYGASDDEEEPNKAPEPTTMAVTPRAPSSTSRAGHGRGSS